MDGGQEVILGGVGGVFRDVGGEFVLWKDFIEDFRAGRSRGWVFLDEGVNDLLEIFGVDFGNWVENPF